MSTLFLFFAFSFSLTVIENEIFARIALICRETSVLHSIGDELTEAILRPKNYFLLFSNSGQVCRHRRFPPTDMDSAILARLNYDLLLLVSRCLSYSPTFLPACLVCPRPYSSHLSVSFLADAERENRSFFHIDVFFRRLKRDGLMTTFTRHH